MADGDETDPLYRVVATEDALDLAAQIAEALGEPFDRRAVAARSEILHETMFADLASSLGIGPDQLVFRSGVYERARAFAGLSREGVPHVVLDLVFDFWVFALGHIMVVKATIELSPEELGRLHRVLDAVFSLFVDNHRFHQLRESVGPLLLDYKYCLNLSHALTRAMTVSVMCHELAHIRLGHLGRPASRDLEFEADAAGAEIFLRHVRDGGAKGPTTVYVDPKIAAAPVLLLRIFDLYEAWLARRGGPVELSPDHPSAAERAARLDTLLRPHLNERAVYILDGMSAALVDLSAEL